MKEVLASRDRHKVARPEKGVEVAEVVGHALR
jgi:hypothetical protein